MSTTSVSDSVAGVPFPRSSTARLVPPQALLREEEDVAGRILVLLAAFAVPIGLAVQTVLWRNFTVSSVTVVLSLPLWLPAAVRRPARLALVTLSALLLVSGIVLGWASASDHEVKATYGLIAATTVLTGLLGVAALTWAASVIGQAPALGLFALTDIVMLTVNPGVHETFATITGENPWKFAYAVPVATLALTVVHRLRRPWLTVATLVALGVISIMSDYRSALSLFLLTALSVLWQARSRPARREPPVLLVATGLLVLASAMYQVLGWLLTSGLLGQKVAERTQAQIEAGGSLLLGGRPEWTVTMRLFPSHPLGYGFGTIPSPVDVAQGRAGFASVHLSSQDDYLVTYVLGQTFRLHSMVADLWAAGGLAGVALAGFLLWLHFAALAKGVARHTAEPAAVFLVLLTLWNLGFSPIVSSAPQLILAGACALYVLERGGSRDTTGTTDSEAQR